MVRTVGFAGLPMFWVLLCSAVVRSQETITVQSAAWELEKTYKFTNPPIIDNFFHGAREPSRPNPCRSGRSKKQRKQKEKNKEKKDQLAYSRHDVRTANKARMKGPPTYLSSQTQTRKSISATVPKHYDGIRRRWSRNGNNSVQLQQRIK